MPIATAAWKAGDAKALTGVPVTVKDLIYVAGTEAKGGTPALDGFVPDVDAAVVTAVEDAGAIITCKTTTCESGYKLTADSPVSGITRNPWHLGRTSGGSSLRAIHTDRGPRAKGRSRHRARHRNRPPARPLATRDQPANSKT